MEIVFKMKTANKRGFRTSFCAAAFAVASACASDGARWIWYPGDFETHHAEVVQARRLEWGGYTPVIWPQYRAYPIVRFSKTVNLAEPEEIDVWVDGQGSFRFPWRREGNMTENHATFKLPAGKATLAFVVQNHATFPSLYVRGKTVKSDGTWSADWLDAAPRAAGSSPLFTDPAQVPSVWRLATEPKKAVSQRRTARGLLADFGEETFGYVVFGNVTGKGRVKVVYGESEKEALSDAPGQADVWEMLDLQASSACTQSVSRAFRHIHVIPQSGDVDVASLSMLYEYLPLEYKGSFRCDDARVNKIWDVSARTLHLSTREFFLDGIKRDRWVWSGDAYQSFLMNYYLFADNESVKRTLWALRGKDPVVRHVNTIVDYSFYWLVAVHDYYLYSGDEAFVKAIWPRMKTMLDFVFARCRADGMYVHKPGDWTFVDWAPKPLVNTEGPVAVIQMLFARALESAADCARLAGDADAARDLSSRMAELRAKVVPTFWSEERGALVHALDRNGRQSAQLTKYANMFGLFYGYFDAARRERAVANGILGKDVLPIQTPYMRFYELEALCSIGRQADVLKEIRSYWGGMLDLGATSFWELYNPTETGDAIYAMYGRPFGRSLCHAWGASPIYLLGRYYLGVEPTKPGFAAYRVKPSLGGLKWMEGDVPTPSGPIHVRMDAASVEVTGNGGEGELVLPNGRTTRIPPRGKQRIAL